MKIRSKVREVFSVALRAAARKGGKTRAEGPAPPSYSRGLVKHGVGVRLHVQGRLGEAIAQYDEAIRFNPLHVGAYYNRGIAYNQLRLYEWAIRDYSQAIRLAPRVAEFHMRRAVAYTSIGKDTNALRDVMGAVELGFDYAVLSAEIEDAISQRQS